jgi:hypothetical protein
MEKVETKTEDLLARSTADFFERKRSTCGAPPWEIPT